MPLRGIAVRGENVPEVVSVQIAVMVVPNVRLEITGRSWTRVVFASTAPIVVLQGDHPGVVDLLWTGDCLTSRVLDPSAVRDPDVVGFTVEPRVRLESDARVPT